MAAGLLQQLLLWSGEYDEMADDVIVEGEFVESDENFQPKRQVIVGMTPEFFIIAYRRISCNHNNPLLYHHDNTHTCCHSNDLDDLEISSAWPLCYMTFCFSTSRPEFSLTVNSAFTRYYELATTQSNGDLCETWKRWTEFACYLYEDPDSSLRAMFNYHDVTFPEQYVTWEDDSAGFRGRSLKISADDKTSQTSLKSDDTLLNNLLDIKAVRELEKRIALISADKLETSGTNGEAAAVTESKRKSVKLPCFRH